MMGKIKNWKRWPVERLSMSVFYTLVALSVLIYALLWFVGYSRPFDENPNFNAPLFSNALIGWVYLLVIGTVGMVAWTVFRTLKVRGKSDSYDNNIPIKKIGYGVVFGVMALLALSFLVGSSTEMLINGTRYTTFFWLKVSDMFIYTSLVLMVIAIAMVVYGSTKYIRKK